MRNTYDKDQSQQQRISPWAEYAEEFSASARARREIRNRLGMRFREAQQEAQEAWAVWDEAMKSRK